MTAVNTTSKKQPDRAEKQSRFNFAMKTCGRPSACAMR